MTLVLFLFRLAPMLGVMQLMVFMCVCSLVFVSSICPLLCRLQGELLVDTVAVFVVVVVDVAVVDFVVVVVVCAFSFVVADVFCCACSSIAFAFSFVVADVVVVCVLSVFCSFVCVFLFSSV